MQSAIQDSVFITRYNEDVGEEKNSSDMYEITIINSSSRKRKLATKYITVIGSNINTTSCTLNFFYHSCHKLERCVVKIRKCASICPFDVWNNQRHIYLNGKGIPTDSSVVSKMKTMHRWHFSRLTACLIIL